MKKSLCLKTDSNLNIRNQNNEIIVPKELKLKNSKKVIHKQITSKYQIKWDTFYEKKFNWISIWLIFFTKFTGIDLFLPILISSPFHHPVF
jgi:late competence protein required for DNA uptake (superfamily II DNA/RNA helicase)